MAETVTISTFLELRDNMSAGLKQVEAALTRLNQAMQSAGRAGAKDPAAKAAQARAKATDFAAKMERQRIAQAEKAATREIRAAQRAMDAKIKASAAATRQRIADERRAAREAERAAARQAKAAENARRDRADFIGKAGAAMFGPTTGGIMSAFVGGGMGAAGPLAVIGLVQGIVNGIKSALSAGYDLVKGFIQKVYELGKEYQMSIRRVAGSLTTMGHVPTFEHATAQAKELYNVMRTLAAKLPGETKDYMEVFSLALPQALHAGEDNLERFTEKVSKFTAYAMARNVSDIQQVARDMERMIMGKAIGRTRMFNEYLAYMQMATKNLKFGVREFNALSMPKRLELMYQVVEKAGATFKYMNNDADTLEGTMRSLIDQLLIVGGQPLFDNALGILRRINKYLTDNNSILTKAVGIVSSELGVALEGAAGLVVDMISGFQGFNGEVSKSLGLVGSLIESLTGAFSLFDRIIAKGREARVERREEELEAKRQQQRAFESDPAFQAALKKMPVGFYPGGMITRIPEKAPDVMTPAKSPEFGPLKRFLMTGGTTDEDVKRAVERGSALASRYQQQLLSTPATVTKGLTPEFKAMPVPFGGLPGIADKDQIESMRKTSIDVLRSGQLEAEAWTHMLELQGVPNKVIDKWFREATGSRVLAGMEAEDGDKKKKRRAPRERQQTINDFRFSKFDIKQEFAEGFDPDRIAVAFASDLAKLGEMRMQSAYAPLFATRSST